MNNIIKFFTYLSIIFLTISPLSGKEDFRIEIQPVAFDEIMNLPHQGVLKQKENGFVYLDVSNEFITAVVPLLDHEGIIRQRPTSTRSMGAHISVFHEGEGIVPQELNKSFSFEVKEIRSFTLHTRDGLKKLWVIAADSPDLENLRQQYGCSPKLKGYDYHITLGKQMPTAPEGWEANDSFSIFNFSDELTDGILADGDFVVVDHDEVLSTAQKVDAIGQLKLKGNGFVYLDVDNQYIDRVWQKLPLEGEFNPVSTKVKKMGAHISVIYEDEMIGKEIWNLQEAGEWFSFEVKELRYFDQKTPNGMKRTWLLAADSPALQRLRMHYGLKPKLKGHDFHITLGSEQVEFPSLYYEEKDLDDDCILEFEYAVPA